MSLLTAKLVQTWNISPNKRNTYVSLTDMMGWFLYENKVAMLASAWTIKWTSDGTTGPSGVGDTTDRWATKANATTRGTAAATVQAYAVLQNTDGLQVLLTYQGATDDVARISYSPGGLFTLAAPTTHQPTASDESIVSAGNTLVSNATSGDRVMTIWCTSDSTQWSHVICRSGSIIHFLGVEKVVSYCGTGVLSVPYVGYRHFEARRDSAGANFPTSGFSITSPAANVAVGTAGFVGAFARVFTNGAFRFTRLCCGWVNMCAAAGGGRNFNSGTLNTLANTTAMQNGRQPLTGLYWGGEKTTNLDGLFGSPIDWWLAYSAGAAAPTGVPAFGQFYPGYDPADNVLTDPERTNWIVAIGPGMLRPWRDVDSVLRIY